MNRNRPKSDIDRTSIVDKDIKIVNGTTVHNVQEGRGSISKFRGDFKIYKSPKSIS